MQGIFSKSIPAAVAAACLAMAVALVAPGRASAQGMMQLTVPASEYTLGGFKYQPPKVDGWRQIANMKDSLSLVYAEQRDESSIETKFGVAIEVHEIPAGVDIPSASALATLSKSQMADNRKNDVVAQSPVEAVPSVDNLYTYRLLVHAPKNPDPNAAPAPDAYEVYYVMMAPDKSQYLVVQCITKTPDYDKELYWTEFYGSLATLKYTGGGKPADAAEKKPDAGSTTH